MKHSAWIFVLAFIPAFVCFGQASAPAANASLKSADEMKALFAGAFERNTPAYLNGPYHFLATFETFTVDGKPDGEGSIEKFFAAPGRLKVITHFRDHRMTTYYVDGKPQYTDDGFDGTIMTYFVNDFLLNPIPPPQGTEHRDLEIKSRQMRNVLMDCGMFQFFVNADLSPDGPKEVYCISRDTHDLILRQTQNFSIAYRDFAPFLDKSIPRYITASEGTAVRCRIHVQQFDQAKLDDSALTPPADASPVSPGTQWTSLKAGEGTPNHPVLPTYPLGLKAAHVTGLVTDFDLPHRHHQGHRATLRSRARDDASRHRSGSKMDLHTDSSRRQTNRGHDESYGQL